MALGLRSRVYLLHPGGMAFPQYSPKSSVAKHQHLWVTSTRHVREIGFAITIVMPFRCANISKQSAKPSTKCRTPFDQQLVDSQCIGQWFGQLKPNTPAEGHMIPGVQYTCACKFVMFGHYPLEDGVGFMYFLPSSIFLLFLCEAVFGKYLKKVSYRVKDL